MATVQEMIEQATGHIQQGNPGSAEQNCAAVLAVCHDDPNAWHLRGVAAHLQGRNFDALAWLERAVRLRPDQALFRYNLGVVEQALGEYDAARESYRRVLALDPGSTSAASNLIAVLTRQGRLSECLTLAEQLVAREACGRHLSQLGNVRKMLGDVQESVEAYTRAVKVEPDNPALQSALLFARQYDPGIDDDDLSAKHRQWAGRFESPVNVSAMDHRPRAKPLRIGFVSPDLGNHPVGIFLAPLLERLDRRRFVPCFYSDRSGQDEFNRRLRAGAALWRDTKSLSHDELFHRIQADGIDIAIDLAGHTDDNRLPVFARRAAPVQISWAGYVGTTGLANMDFLLCDRFHVPPELESLHAERPLRMPHGYVCYEPPGYAPEVNRTPSAETGHVTFGCLNNPCKVNHQTVALFSAVMQRVPGSKLLFKYRGFDDPLVQKQLIASFGAQGIDADRLLFRGGTTHGDHLATFHETDISLDPTPYSGGLTTCESIWMGVPVVTCPRRRFASRHSLSHLTNAGVTGTVASSHEHFVDIAVELATDVEKLSELRRVLRPTMAASPLCDADQFTRDFQQAMETAIGQPQ